MDFKHALFVLECNTNFTFVMPYLSPFLLSGPYLCLVTVHVGLCQIMGHSALISEFCVKVPHHESVQGE